MARKSMGKAAKVLGGLGAAYALSKMAVGAGVRPEDVDRRSEAQKQRDAEAIANLPKYNPSLVERMQRRREDDRRREGLPAISPEEHASIMHEVKGVRDSSGIPIKAGDGVLQETDPSMRAVRPQPPRRYMLGDSLEFKQMFDKDYRTLNPAEFKKGGAVKAKPKKMASGGMSSASKRGDGIASRGKTKCKIY